MACPREFGGARLNATQLPQYMRVKAVEDEHWWFVGLRELVAQTIGQLVPESGRILDAGCGTGRVLAELPERYDRVGVDLNPDVLAVAGALSGLELHKASLESLPFEDASFDAAFSLDVISDARLLDPAAALRELRRVLRPGAPLVLNLPAYEFLRGGHDIAAQTARRYTSGGVRRLLCEYGFEPERVGYRMTLLFPAAALARLLSSRDSASDVGEVAPRVNRALTRVLRIENRLIAHRMLPFGLSVFAVARRPPVAE